MTGFDTMFLLLFLCYILRFAKQEIILNCQGHECALNCVNGYLNDSGQCICFDIWQGANCTEHKCQNGAIPDSAMNGMHNQTCKCRKGRGQATETEYGMYCEKHRCTKHGAYIRIKQASVVKFLCICYIGYTGSNCDQCIIGYEMNKSGECQYHYDDNAISNYRPKNYDINDYNHDDVSTSGASQYYWLYALIFVISVVGGCFCTVYKNRNRCNYARTPATTDLLDSNSRPPAALPPRSAVSHVNRSAVSRVFIRPASTIELHDHQSEQTLAPTENNANNITDNPPEYAVIAMQDELPPSYEQALNLCS